MKTISWFCLKYLLTGIMSLTSISITAQYEDKNNQDQDHFDIRWVSQYPAKRDTKTRRNENWFTDLFFGKKPDDLVKPMSVVAMNPDSYWVADQGNGSILQVRDQQGKICKFANRGIDNIPSIVGSCFSQDHKILFTDSRLNQVFIYDPLTQNLEVLIDSIYLVQPTGIAYSLINQQIWVVETGAHRISVFDSKGELIKRIGGRGNIPGMFNFPTYLWIDDQGIVYVVDAMNFRIQILDRNGEFISAFGEPGDSSGFFSRPKGIATDSFGHIYLADALFNVVQVFDRSGELLSIFGSQGQAEEQFWMPTGIYIDAENFIYIADSYNSRVQVFQLSSEK